MKVHEKSTVFRQGEDMPFSWTEVGVMMDYPEGVTLRIKLKSEKEENIVKVCIGLLSLLWNSE